MMRKNAFAISQVNGINKVHSFCERAALFSACEPSSRNDSTYSVDNCNRKIKSKVLSRLDGRKVLLFRGRLPVLDDMIFSGEAEIIQQFIPELVEGMRRGSQK